MTTAAKDPPQAEETETKTWTLREIEKQEQTLADLRDKIVELDLEAEELREMIALAMADGKDASGWKDALRENEELRDDLVGVEPVLAERIEERRWLAYKELARQRIQEIRKKAGGLAGEVPRRGKKAEELAGKLVGQLEWLAGVNTRRRLLDLEARTLATVFGLTEPALRAPVVDTDRLVARLKRQAGEVQGPGDALTLSIHRALREGDTTKAASKLAHQLENLYDEGTPTPEILEAVDDPAAKAGK